MRHHGTHTGQRNAEGARFGAATLVARAATRAMAAFLPALLLLAACSHRLVVETNPPDAQVHALDDRGRRTKMLGRSPLVLEDVDAPSLQGVLIEKPGFVPRRVDVPFAASSDVRLDVDLQQLDREFISSLPPEALRAVIDSKMGELVSFQQTLFSSNPEEGEREVAALADRLGGTAAFHYIVGSWQFYLGRYEDATRSFTRSLELAPDFEQARRMLVLTDVKSISRTQVARTRAFGSLQAAASEVASLGNGFLVRTKSSDTLTEPDGFEIILPTDGLFRPTTAKLKKDGLPLLQQLAGELKRLDQAFSLTVEAHTDSDFSAEVRNVPGAVVAGKPAFKSAWELSSARAAAVLELLRGEGVNASLYNIAGYGDSRPLQVRAGPPPAPQKTQPGAAPQSQGAGVDTLAAPQGIAPAMLPADGSLTRRIVVRVALLGRTVPVPVVSREESERLRERLRLFLENDDDELAATPTKRGRTVGGARDAQPVPPPTRLPPLRGLPGTRGDPSSSSVGQGGAGGSSSSPSTGSARGGVPSPNRNTGGTLAPLPRFSGGDRDPDLIAPIPPRRAPAGDPSRGSAARPGDPSGTRGLSAKPLTDPNAPGAPSPAAKRRATPPPVRDVAPNAIPRPRVPVIKPQAGTPSDGR